MDGAIGPGQWLDVCGVEDVPLRGARCLRVEEQEIGVFRSVSGEFFALENRCPHKQGPLSEGIVHDTAVTCPLHNWVIDLESGMARGNDVGQVRTYQTQVTEGRVLLKLEN